MLLAVATVVFSEGSGGYAGTQDTHVRLEIPGGSFGGDGTVMVDLDESSLTGNQPSHGLMRFDNIFGPGPGQVPLGATITAATLTVRTGTATGDSSTTPISLHRMLVDWDEASNWDSLNDGVSADGVEAAAAADGTVTPSVAGGTVAFHVLATLQAWANSPGSNFGWAFLPGGINGWGLLSSEWADPSLRPELSITYDSAQAPINQAPAVSAGSDQMVTLPSSATLNGTVTDDGLPNPPGAVTTTWSTFSGPGTVTFGNAAAIDTTASFSTTGTYVLRLTASDGEFATSDDVTIVVNAQASNQAPSVSAGPDQTITLPSSATLNGTVTDDGLPNPPGAVTTTWTKFSGPGTVTFGNAAAVDTTASFSAAGTYVLRLSAYDAQFTSVDDVTILVNPSSATNRPPTVNAGADRNALSGRIYLDAMVTDDGLPNPPGAVTTQWSKVTGPGSAKFGNASEIDTTVRFNSLGTYVLRLTASDGQFSVADDITITVLSTSVTTNRAPSVSAGPDQSVVLPSSATLNGTVTDDGEPNPPGVVRTNWSMFSGPGPVTFGNAAAVDTTASFSIAGTYVLRLSAYDGELTRTDDVIVTVTGNQGPAVNAGPDQTINLPSSATLNGTVTDDGLPNPPGTITTTWSMFSGPGTVTFANAAAVDTTAGFSTTGTYVLRLTADDGEYTFSDDVTIVVNPQPANQAPAVNAGSDQTIALSSSATLNGTVTDDGLPNPPGAVTTTWSKFSGPGTVTFGNAAAIDTTASFSTTGTYVLRLSASDGQLSSADDVTIVVNSQATNQAPTVSAGPDLTITLPSSATLNGTVTDDGLPNPPGAVTTTWSRFSGPGIVTFANAAAVDTTASFSAAGTYVLRLTANDGELTRSDDVTVTVQSAPATPTIQTLNPVSSTANSGEKPQSKVWKYANTWWSVFPNSTGTWVWRLDNTTWTPVFRINTRTAGKADVLPVGGVAHVLLFEGSASTRLASIQYVAGSPGTYQFWSQRSTVPTIPLSSGVEMATLAMDGAGRMWIASDSGSTIEVRYSDGNYGTWSAPITIASSVGSDDISDITTLPNGSVAVIWSNQSTKRFGFRTHAPGASPTSWTADENPASQSALNVGAGFSDDHMSLAVTSDGTVYAAVKTSYDRSGYPVIGLLVRRPNGQWDNFYSVDTDLGATRPIVVVNESQGIVMVVYRSGAFDIVYRQAPLSNPGSFGTRKVLIAGDVNNVSSTRQVLDTDGVFLATDYPASGGEIVRSARFIWGATASATQTTSLAGTTTTTTTNSTPFSSGRLISRGTPEDEENLLTQILA